MSNADEHPVIGRPLTERRRPGTRSDLPFSIRELVAMVFALTVLVAPYLVLVGWSL